MRRSRRETVKSADKPMNSPTQNTKDDTHCIFQNLGIDVHNEVAPLSGNEKRGELVCSPSFCYRWNPPTFSVTCTAGAGVSTVGKAVVSIFVPPSGTNAGAGATRNAGAATGTGVGTNAG